MHMHIATYASDVNDLCRSVSHFSPRRRVPKLLFYTYDANGTFVCAMLRDAWLCNKVHIFSQMYLSRGGDVLPGDTLLTTLGTPSSHVQLQWEDSVCGKSLLTINQHDMKLKNKHLYTNKCGNSVYFLSCSLYANRLGVGPQTLPLSSPAIYLAALILHTLSLICSFSC